MGGSKKQVSFKEKGMINTVTRKDLPNIAQQIIQEKLGSIRDGVKSIYDRSKEVE